MLQELHYRIALTLIPQVGDVVARELLQHFGTATNIFQARRHQLERIPGVGIQGLGHREVYRFQAGGPGDRFYGTERDPRGVLYR